MLDCSICCMAEQYACIADIDTDIADWPLSSAFDSGSAECLDPDHIASTNYTCYESGVRLLIIMFTNNVMY